MHIDLFDIIVYVYFIQGGATLIRDYFFPVWHLE